MTTPFPDCYSCRQNASHDALPPRERIASDARWRVAHSISTSLPGWLVLIPRRHVTSIAGLTEEESADLGRWQVRLSRALHDATGCAKTYVAQFAEKPGFEHVHFHVVPRMADLAPELHGPKAFALLNPPEAERVPTTEMDRIALALRERLECG
ncbi:HIT family protein [Embleya sp. NBC_00896]|uniref:HIT family protein n=1 Tax=Embleya sp. NBC_00896 TaxID=2975961 RepID=UPI002F918D88|nr:HIT family protein [Embleya sp. NBC_00896]